MQGLRFMKWSLEHVLQLISEYIFAVCYGLNHAKNTCFLKECIVKHRIFMCFWSRNAPGKLKMALLGAILELLRVTPDQDQNKVQQRSKFCRCFDSFLDLMLSLLPLFLRGISDTMFNGLGISWGSIWGGFETEAWGP